MITESADAALLYGNQNAVIIGQLTDEVDIERLHESGIGDSHTKVRITGFHFVRGLDGLPETRSNCEDSHTVLPFVASRVGGRVVAKSTGGPNNSALADW